jgi:hypothetical protein
MPLHSTLHWFHMTDTLSEKWNMFCHFSQKSVIKILFMFQKIANTTLAKILDFSNKGWCQYLLAHLISGWKWHITNHQRQLLSSASQQTGKALHMSGCNCFISYINWCGTQSQHTLLNSSSLWTKLWAKPTWKHGYPKLLCSFPKLAIQKLWNGVFGLAAEHHPAYVHHL